MKQDIIDKIQKIIGNQSTNERDLLFQLKGVLYETEFQNQIVRESKSIGDLVSENLALLNKETHQGNAIKTDFDNFDRSYGGFGFGEFIVIGGRPGMGKTQLLVNLALNISVEIPLLYFSFEMSEFSLTCRFISSFSGIDVHRILQNELTDEQKNKLVSIGNNFNNHKLYVNDSCNNSITALKALCLKHIEENGVKVIVVDYLQMMSSNKYRNNREYEISQISRELKNIAKDNNICVIATSQMSRAVETRGGDKRPQLSDLRESGAIEQDADKVIFIYRPEYYGIDSDEDGNSTAGLIEIILAKNRNGYLGTVKLMRDANFTKFRDFDGYNNDFSISQSRLDEIDEIEAPF